MFIMSDYCILVWSVWSCESCVYSGQQEQLVSGVWERVASDGHEDHHGYRHLGLQKQRLCHGAGM